MAALESQENTAGGESGSGSDDDREDDPKNGVKHEELTTERRLREDSVFTQWLTARQSRVCKDRPVDSAGVTSEVQTSEIKRIITSPRQYQLELFEMAKKQNTIVVLDTGMPHSFHQSLIIAVSTPGIDIVQRVWQNSHCGTTPPSHCR